ncbi:MAG: hypothetical protein IJ197_07135 [Bacteroidaceae bacterium]|nr:hypothetical protein [Bacteroidaceae bacterium]
MKRILTSLLLFSISQFLNVICAQRTPVEKYELIPASFEHVFIDHVQGFASRIIDLNANQYLGQTTKDGKFYGYGRFISDDGSEIIGKFRDGKLLFGITIGQNSVLVGDHSNYASYSLATGKLEFIYKANERVLIDTKSLADYGFYSMKYANGDQYVGEVYQQQRHGYGMYYYTNGDFWFGQYNNDKRSGFGAYFSIDGNIQIGQWRGDNEVRVLLVKKK